MPDGSFPSNRAARRLARSLGVVEPTGAGVSTVWGGGLARGDYGAHIGSVETQAVADYLDGVCGSFNESMDRHGAHPDLRLCRRDGGGAIHSVIRSSPHLTRLAREGIGAPGFAKFPGKLDVIAQALWWLVRDESHGDLAIHAETQWGKTIVMIMLILLLNHANHLLDRPEAVVMITPNRNDPTTATRRDLAAARSIHGSLTLNPDSGQTIGNVSVEEFTLKKNRAGLREIDRLIDLYCERGIRTITFVVDEADEALKFNSLYAQIVRRATKRGMRVRLVLISATGYAYNWISRFQHIRATITPEEGYSGTVCGRLTRVMSFSDFTEFAPGIGDIRVSLYRDPERFAKWQDSFLRDHTWAVRMGEGMNTELVLGLNHNDYRSHCAESFLRLVAAEVNNEPDDKDGPFGGGRGALLRFGQCQRHLDDLIEQVGDLCEDMGVRIIRYFDLEKKKKRDGEDLEDRLAAEIDGALATHKYCIVAVIQSGRRADRLPRCITRGWDFTEQFRSMPSAEQGTLGRLSGYAKFTNTQNTLVLLSETNNRMIQAFRRHFLLTGVKLPLMIVPETKKLVGRFLVQTDKLHVRIDDPGVPHAGAIRAWVRSRVSPHVSEQEMVVNGKPRAVVSLPRKRAHIRAMAATPGVRVDVPPSGQPLPLFDLFAANDTSGGGVLTPAVIADILRFYGFPPHAQVIAPWTRHAARLKMLDGDVAISVGAMGRGKGDIAGLGGGDNECRNKTSAQSTQRYGGTVRPELMFERDTLEPALLVLALGEAVFRETDAARDVSAGDLVAMLPSSKNMLHDRMSEDQRAMVEEIEAEEEKERARYRRPRS